MELLNRDLDLRLSLAVSFFTPESVRGYLSKSRILSLFLSQRDVTIVFLFLEGNFLGLFVRLVHVQLIDNDHCVWCNMSLIVRLGRVLPLDLCRNEKTASFGSSKVRLRGLALLIYSFYQTFFKLDKLFHDLNS